MSNVNFAPYQPPPDERLASQSSSTPSSSRKAAPAVPSVPRSPPPQQTRPPQENLSRASLDSDLDPRYATESYQASSSTNGPPYASSAASSYKQSFQSTPAWATQQHQQQSSKHHSSAPPQHRPFPQNNSRPDHLSYSTAHGWNLSNLCFAAWALPPFSSVLLLIYETENDLVRFHAYQSGLVGVGFVLLIWLLRALFGWYTFSIIVGMAFIGYFWVCGSNAATSAPTLARAPYLSYVGPLAEQWVGEE